MKESKSLKASKSNILVGLYLDDKFHEGQLSECFYSLANQSHEVDVVILDGGMSDKDIEALINVSKSPSIKTMQEGEDGAVTEKIIKSEKELNINIIKTEKSNFSRVFNTVFNIALESGYEAFSVVEIEDSIAGGWYSIANTYMKENEDTHFFLPMVRSFRNGVLTGLMNEAAWAEGMSEEAGKFDMNLLLKFNCANPLGGLYRTSELEEYSEEKDGRLQPMKESVKISHYYEFFLRMMYNDLKMMTIPRIGYDFRVNDVKEFKESSSKVPNNIVAIPSEKGGLSAEETSFWVELAKQEYFFDEDRIKKYEQES